MAQKSNDLPADNLSIKTKVGYGAGLVFNYIIGALMSSYSLLFYQNVVQLDKTKVGIIYWIGMSITGVSSPIVGLLSDMDSNSWMCNTFGSRKVVDSVVKSPFASL